MLARSRKNVSSSSPPKNRTPRKRILPQTVRSLLGARPAEKAQVRLAAIVENADEPIVSKDLNGLIMSWNSAAQRLFGYSAAEVIGRPVAIIVPPELQSQEEEILHRLARGERIEQLETVRVARDGRRIDVLVTISPIRDEAGHIIGASKIIRDISPRKRAEEALRGSETRLKTILENLHEGLIVFDRDGTTLRWNRRALEMHGYAAHEEPLSVFADVKDLYEVLTPDGTPVPVEQWPIPRLVREGHLHNYELLVRHKQKDWQRVLNYGGLILPAGNGVESLGLLTIRDVTDQKRAEEALCRSEERYRCFVQASSQVVWIMNPSGQFEGGRQAWHDYTGQSLEEARGFGWIDAVFPEDRQKVLDAWLKAANSREGYEVEYRLRRHDGEWRHMQARGVPVLNDDGSIREWIGTCTDITERKQAEAELRESRNRLVMAQRAGRLGVFDWDLTTGKMLWTDELEALVGLSPGTFEGTYEGWATRVDPEDLRRLELLVRQRMEQQQPRVDFDYRIRRADGEVRWFSARSEIMYALHGKPLRMLGTNVDITERKRAEEALQRQAALIDLTPTAMLVRTPGGRISFWNKGAEALYGWKVEQAIGRITHDLLQTQFPQPFEQIVETLRLTGRWSGELRHQTRDGGWVIVHSWWLAERGPEGEVTQILESNVDVTERKRFQQQLENLVAERTAKLQETVADLEHFSYTITHDMRSPLRAMQGFGRMLELEYWDRLDEAARDYLRRIIDSSQRMDHLITDALSYAKVVKQELSLGPVDAEALLRSMADSYPEFQLPKAEVKIVEGIPPVLGSTAVLTQCFSNLLGNAVKFVAPGTRPRVTVWGEHRDSRVRIWVEDNGIGIRPQDQERIFTMFQRLSKEHEGTGIGLVLVKKGVERMHGRVGLESEPGKGSRFWIELQPAPSSITVRQE